MRESMKRFLVSIVICAAIVAAGYAATRAGSTLRARDAAPPDNTPKPSGVKVQVVQPGPLEDRLVLTGVVQPWEDVRVSAEATGVIERQDVVEGQEVSAGQELIRVDTSLVQAQLDQASAQQRLASQELQRAETLSTKGITTGQAMDKAQADKDMAEANLRLFKIRIDKSVVKAPIAGIIDTLFKEENEFIDMGTPLFRLVQLHKVKICFGIPEREICCFKKGDATLVSLDALEGKQFTGVIHKLAPTADTSTLTFPCEVEVDNPERLIKPGMIGRVALLRKQYADAISVPLFAVLSVENQRFVYVEDGGKARMRPIETGVIQGNRVQVVQGLGAGDRLIVSGQRSLQDGDAVSVLETVDAG